MLLKFPTMAQDWVSIWQQTFTITLITKGGEKMPILVDAVEPFYYSVDGTLMVVRMTMAHEEFYICFDECILELNDELTFYFNGNRLDRGYWSVPDRYVKHHDDAQS